MIWGSYKQNFIMAAIFRIIIILHTEPLLRLKKGPERQSCNDNNILFLYITTSLYILKALQNYFTHLEPSLLLVWQTRQPGMNRLTGI